ncbi:MAG: hypothetical protein JXX29_12415 [Deltaproteobacteria bacterium]|nr:hypothetical protein [Deltaproteobacteria bacterium]MBN2672478.1 hypothetical protein [Deltaproteobacteria bacterium]
MKQFPTLIFLITLLFCTMGWAEDPAATETPQTSNTADEAAHAPPSTTTPPPDVEVCVPKCRSGFMCHAGMCISLCNPPCGAGYACSAQGECLMQVQQSTPAVAMVPAAPMPITERDIARQQARERKQQIRQQRKQAVKRFRLSAHMDWQWAFIDDVYRTGFVGNLGMQKNLADTFALRLRVGGLIGYARPAFLDDSDRTTCWGANIDLAPLFGPLGTFYIGPTFWLTYYWHGKNRLEESDWWDETIDYVELDNGPAGGIALDMGLLIGDDANLGINWRVKTTLTEEFSFIFEFGLAYHFDVGGK